MSSHGSESRRSGDPVKATAWLELDDEDYFYEGDELRVHAELTDVDEVTLVIARASTDDDLHELIARASTDDDLHELTIHLDRVAAIALAGQLAATATMSPALLPHGHGPDGPLT